MFYVEYNYVHILFKVELKILESGRLEILIFEVVPNVQSNRRNLIYQLNMAVSHESLTEIYVFAGE
jgi:hypothetical protein